MKTTTKNALSVACIIWFVGGVGVIADRALAGEGGQCCFSCGMAKPDGSFEIATDCRDACNSSQECTGDCGTSKDGSPTATATCE